VNDAYQILPDDVANLLPLIRIGTGSVFRRYDTPEQRLVIALCRDRLFLVPIRTKDRLPLAVYRESGIHELLELGKLAEEEAGIDWRTIVLRLDRIDSVTMGPPYAWTHYCRFHVKSGGETYEFALFRSEVDHLRRCFHALLKGRFVEAPRNLLSNSIITYLIGILYYERDLFPLPKRLAERARQRTGALTSRG
jgi:hypothetical protein